MRALEAVSVPAATVATEVEVLIEPPSRAIPPETAAAAAEDQAPVAVARAETSRGSPLEATSGASATGPAAPSAEPAGDGAWSFNPGAPPAGSGALAGLALDRAIGSGVGETIAQDRAKDDATKHAFHSFTAREYELGLVPGSAWVGMTRDAIRRGRTPLRGSAVLEFTTDAKGLVASVRVLDATSDRDAWDEVATALVAQARTATITVPSGANGMAVTMQIRNKVLTPEGHEVPEGSGSTILGAASKALGAINDPLGTIADAKQPPHKHVQVWITDAHAF
jgi:hypothetical protein